MKKSLISLIYPSNMKIALSLVFFALTGIRLSAVTILSVTGGISQFGVGIFPTQSVALSFTVNQSYSNVSISPELVGLFSGTAFLTTQIGAGTTAADEIASGSFASTGGFVPVLQNLSIDAGTYFLVLSTTQLTPPQGWATALSPVTVSDNGASSPFGLYVHSGVDNAYAPSDNFFLYTVEGTPRFVITGLPGSAVPDTSNTFALVSFALMGLVVVCRLEFGRSR